MSRDAVQGEVERQHRFFEDWFNGVEGRAIDELADSLDDEFFIVSPNGTISDRSTIVKMVEEHWGSEPVDIHIENVELKRDDPGLLIATYKEYQNRQAESAVIASTVGLVADSTKPGGFRWIFVHESWIQSPEP
ncbi:MAG: hypothetical protein QGM48_10110 [Actinomycetota bacterium]|nr:hypothetical protein [Actinomycetota bacterium]